ncbi:MAG: peptide deformylase [Verrucomicrobiota bacterium]
MKREIVIYGDPVLREKGSRVEQVTDEVRVLVEDMLETMVEAEGIGLAAPQVGIAIQLAVADIGGATESVTYLRVDGEERDVEESMPLVFMNPEIEYGPERDAMEEGCLSIPDVRASVTRPTALKMTMDTLDGKRVELETDGLLARVIQHEVDHLFGVLFVDRLSAAKKLGLKRVLRELASGG